jgi:hypothetical protein
MRITEGVIYLSQPVAGCWQLEGPATIGTTWLDYTMPEDAPMSGVAQDGADGVSLHGRRLLIPITNVIAVVLPAEAGDAYRAPLP